MMNKKHTSPVRLWAVLFWLAIWQLASMKLNQRILLVSPAEVLLCLAGLVKTAGFWLAVGFSSLRILSGFFLALFSGILYAALSSRFRPVRELLAPFVLTIKSVPVASFIILALIWFSSGSLSILISFLMVFPVIYTSMLGSLLHLDRQLLEMAEVFHITGIRRFRLISLPQLLPDFYSACKISLGLCWKSGIAAEVIGLPSGSIGAALQQARIYLDTPELFAWTLTIILCSLLFERIFLFFLKKLSSRLILP